MNVSLPSEMVDFVEHEVATGGYASSSEVVREALRLLQRERAQEQEKIAILRREVAIGLAAAEEGNFSSRSALDIAEQIIAEQVVRE